MKKIWWGLSVFAVLIVTLWVFLYIQSRPNETLDEPFRSEPVVQSRKLPIPELLEDMNPDDNVSEYYLSAQYGVSSFMGDMKTSTMGYNGNYLGPVIKTKNGETVKIHFSNEMDEATSVLWHGLVVPGTADGGPHQVIQAGSSWEPEFTIDQPAATLWFHPHVIGTTAIQVYYGLAGMIIVEDDDSTRLNLPNVYGVNDIPLIIQDRSFDTDGSFSYYDNMMDGAFGEYILVNGAIEPELEVGQVKMRFRVLNGANARNFYLKLDDNSAFHQIASDGGLLESPVKMNSLSIAPGERSEIIVDFSKYSKGDEVKLLHDNKLVMTFKVGEQTEDLTEIPENLAVIEKLDSNQASKTKRIILDGMGHMVSINGRKFDMNRIDDVVELNDIEIWEITTAGAMMMGSQGHPFHIHGTQFQVLSRNGDQPFANELGWKDTVYVRANETVKIVVKFRKAGIFMFHCHILEHEEAGMMGQLEVK